MGGSNSSTGVVSGGVGVAIQEQVESVVASSAQVLDEDILEVLEGDLLVGVGIVGVHELKSFLSVGWMVNVEGTVKIRDELSSFHGVHESTSVGVVLGEDLLGKDSGALLVESSFVDGGDSAGSNSGCGWSDSSGDWGSCGVGSSDSGSSDSAGWGISGVSSSGSGLSDNWGGSSNSLGWGSSSHSLGWSGSSHSLSWSGSGVGSSAWSGIGGGGVGVLLNGGHFFSSLDIIFKIWIIS